MENILNDKDLSQVTGGTVYYFHTEAGVNFRYNVGSKISILRKTDWEIVEGDITDRGINKSSDGKTFYACYYVEIHDFTGSGWLGDIDGIKFENRIYGTPYKTGL